MIKILRSKPIINKPIRSLLKGLVVNTPGELINYFTKRWRVAGQVEIQLDGVKFKFYSNCDDGIVDALYYYPNNYSEVNELMLFSRLAVRSEFILDIGANTGVYSVFSSVRNRNCEVWAFEPYPSNYDRLKLNLSLNNCDNVVSLPKALGNERKTIKISVPDNNQICDTVSANSEFSKRFYKEFITYKEIEVEQVKLDEIIPHGKKVDLIKIDVESYEIPVLEGAKNILKMMSPVIQCEIFVDETRTDFYAQVLKPSGYNCYMMLKNGLAFTESLKPNTEGRDFLFTKRKLVNHYTPYEDESLVTQLIP